MSLEFLKKPINGETYKEKRDLSFGSENDAPNFRIGKKFSRVCTHQRFHKGYNMEDYENFLNQLDFSWLISVDWNQDLTECVVIYVKEVEVQNN